MPKMTGDLPVVTDANYFLPFDGGVDDRPPQYPFDPSETSDGMHSSRSTTPLVPLTAEQLLRKQLRQQQRQQQRQHQRQLHPSSSSTVRLVRNNELQREDTSECVEKYKDRFSFLKDSKFLRDLENDSVDSDIIEEELNALQQGPVRTRDKVVKFLQSNPVQILLCVIVLLDAGIVIAQILLDLNSVKEKLHRRDVQLQGLMSYIRRTHRDRLQGYEGDDVDAILRLLQRHETMMNFTHTTQPSPLPSSSSSSTSSSTMSSFGTALANVTISINEVINLTRTLGDKLNGSGMRISHGADHDENFDENYERKIEDDTSMHEVAHGLHFASIAMLGLLVVEDFIKIVAMGKNFFKHKIEIFDAIIIGASFTIDLVFLGGVSGEEGQKAAAVLVILLLWRIARVVDGIVITVKQRQEFRIRLQKRARRTAEKKLEVFEEERQSRTKQIEALKDLCNKAGINEADIAACAPKQPKQMSATLGALSSVAKLSVSMTMLMSSGLCGSHPDDPCGREGSGASIREGEIPCDNRISTKGKGGTKGSHSNKSPSRKSYPDDGTTSRDCQPYRNKNDASCRRHFDDDDDDDCRVIVAANRDVVAAAETKRRAFSVLKSMSDRSQSRGGGKDDRTPADKTAASGARCSVLVTHPNQRPSSSPSCSPINNSGVRIIVDGTSEDGYEQQLVLSSCRSPPWTSSGDNERRNACRAAMRRHDDDVIDDDVIVGDFEVEDNIANNINSDIVARSLTRNDSESNIVSFLIDDE